MAVLLAGGHFSFDQVSGNLFFGIGGGFALSSGMPRHRHQTISVMKLSSPQAPHAILSALTTCHAFDATNPQSRHCWTGCRRPCVHCMNKVVRCKIGAALVGITRARPRSQCPPSPEDADLGRGRHFFNKLWLTVGRVFRSEKFFLRWCLTDVKNPKAPAVTREAEEDWGNRRWSRARR